MSETKQSHKATGKVNYIEYNVRPDGLLISKIGLYCGKGVTIWATALAKKLTYKKQVNPIWENFSQLELVNKGDTITITFEFKPNTYNSKTTSQVMIKGLELEDSETPWGVNLRFYDGITTLYNGSLYIESYKGELFEITEDIKVPDNSKWDTEYMQFSTLYLLSDVATQRDDDENRYKATTIVDPFADTIKLLDAGTRTADESWKFVITGASGVVNGLDKDSFKELLGDGSANTTISDPFASGDDLPF